MDGIGDKVRSSPLMRDLSISGTFGVVGIAGYSSADALLSHLAGVAIGFGFGYAIRSVMVGKRRTSVAGKADLPQAQRSSK